MDIIKLYWGFFVIVLIVRSFMIWQTPYFPVKISLFPIEVTEVSNNVSKNIVVEQSAVDLNVTNGMGESVSSLIEENQTPLAFYFFILFIGIIAAIGIFGFAFKKEIFNPLVWRIFLPVFFIVEVFITISVGLANFWTLLLSLSYLLPGIYSIFLYGYKYRWLELELKNRKAAEGKG